MNSVQLWSDMKQLCLQILNLSLDDEQSAVQLNELQDKQAQLRKQLVPGTGSKPPFDIQELLDLELQIRRKLHDKKDEFARHIQNFKQVGRVKTFYEGKYAQTQGYFIDKQK